MHIAQVKVSRGWIEIWRQPATPAYKPFRPTGNLPWRLIDAATGEVVETGGNK